MEIIFGRECIFSLYSLFVFIIINFNENIDEYVEKSKSNDPCTEEKIIFL